MINNNIDRTNFVTISSKVVGTIWTCAVITFAVYIGILNPFPAWYVILIAGFLELLLVVFHYVISTRILNQQNSDKNIKYMQCMMFLNFIVLNIPLFSFQLVLLFHYRKSVLF